MKLFSAGEQLSRLNELEVGSGWCEGCKTYVKFFETAGREPECPRCETPVALGYPPWPERNFWDLHHCWACGEREPLHMNHCQVEEPPEDLSWKVEPLTRANKRRGKLRREAKRKAALDTPAGVG